MHFLWKEGETTFLYVYVWSFVCRCEYLEIIALLVVILLS